jgi:release factor glutamine methyltransferase
VFQNVTLAQAIQEAEKLLRNHGVPEPRLDAELLLRHVLGRDRAWLLARLRESLDEAVKERFDSVLERRAAREPIQYITGSQEFWGLDFAVTRDTLVPRPETELIVETVLRDLGSSGKSGRQQTIIDLCSGSGCIAVSLAHELPAARFFATDASEAAIGMARENARRHDVAGRIRFLTGDLFGPLQELDLAGRVDVIASNPPYIAAADRDALQPEVRDFEPAMALFAGPEGTELHRRIIEGAPEFLAPDGSLIMEMGIGQAEALSEMVRQSGAFGPPEIVKDLAGIDRLIVAKIK